MGKLSDKAKKIDFYASRPVLSFGKDGKVYSRLGLLLTLLTVIIIGGMAVWLGIRIFGRQTPSFIQYELPPKVYNPKIPFNTDIFKFSLTIGLGIDEDNRLVRYTPSFIDGHNSKYIPMTVKDCIFDQTSGSWQKCFSQPEETKSSTYLDTVGFWGFNIDYDYCVNTDIFYDCYSPEEAKANMKTYSYSTVFFYEDLLIDPFDYENPITTTITRFSDLIMLDVPRTVTVEINEIEFISDNGWLFEDLKTETRLKATLSTRVGNRDIFNYEFKYGGNKTVYKRTYPKIQDFLAQISGLITIIFPIFIIVVSPYGRLQAIQHMVNEIYEIKLNKPNNDSNSPQKSSSKSKKKRRSSKSKTNLTSPKETEGDLLPQKAEPKIKSDTMQPSNPNRKVTPLAPHAALVIGGLGKSPTREEALPIPDENPTPLKFETFEKSPSSPFKLNSITSRPEEESNLISPQKSLFESAKSFPQKLEEEKLDENLEEKKEIENQSPIDESEIEGEEEEGEEVLLRTSDPLELSLQDWLKSFFRPNPKVQVLNKAKEHIIETFDLVTLSKKVIEIDKLKACLLTHDQRVIFENLPSSVIVLNPDLDLKSPEAIKQYHWKDSFKGDEIALRKAYSRLKETKNQLDQLLIRLYESEYIDDGFCQEGS